VHLARPGRRSLLAAVLSISLAVSGCSHDSGSRKAFCTAVTKAPPLSGVLAGYDRADPAELSRRLASTRSAYDDLQRSAPSDIKGDAAKTVSLVDAILDAVSAHAADPNAVRGAIRATMAKHTDAGPAAAKVAAYASERCGVDLAPVAVTTTPSTTTAASTTTSTPPSSATTTTTTPRSRTTTGGTTRTTTRSSVGTTTTASPPVTTTTTRSGTTTRIPTTTRGSTTTSG
jgi:hypothetical protein